MLSCGVVVHVLMSCACPRQHGQVHALDDTYRPRVPAPGPAAQAWLQRVVQACQQQCPAAVPALQQLTAADVATPQQRQMLQTELQQALAAGAPVVVPAAADAPAELWRQARQHAPLSMRTAAGIEVAQGIFYCDACHEVLTVGRAWHGCPHDTRCEQCHYSNSTTRGAAEGSSAGSGGSASGGGSGSSSRSSSVTFQSKA